MKNRANTITAQEAPILYKQLIEEAIENKMWLKAKGLNVWVSPFEIQKKWEQGQYLFPVSYWYLERPHNYLKPFALNKQKADNLYNYAHKRYAAYVQMLDKEA